MLSSDELFTPSKSLLAPLHPYFEIFFATLGDALIALIVLGTSVGLLCLLVGVIRAVVMDR